MRQASNASTEEPSDIIVIPAFKRKWEAEFQKCSYQPSIFLGCCWISSVYLIMKGSKGIADDKSGKTAWIWTTWSPYLFTCTLYIVCAFVLSFRHGPLQHFCVKNYSAMCAVTTFAIHITVIAPKVVMEIRRTHFEPPVHLKWEVDFNHMLPSRTCTDISPIQTWREPKIAELNLENAG